MGLIILKDEMVSEKFLGGVPHAFVFGRGNVVKWCSLASGFTIFDFGEVNMVILDGNKVNFISFGLEIFGDNGVTE